ncbi:uncharacterized protein LOC128549542 isoform X2 [Mercenaria mercenaria]|nr:uncharacterized protein LOC128549542 isoform X2 [Mercenaria mercenaria]
MDILDCCDICGEGHSTEFCPELGLNITQTELDQLSTRARLTLPGIVQVVDNGSGLVGVVAKETIANKTQLGPYEAKRTTHIFDDSGFFTLKLIAKDGTTVCLDTTDENECNWLCLVRAASSESTKNCIAYQLGNNIFYNTTREIIPGEELLVWYAPHFARKLGKPSEPDGETRVLLGHRIEPLTSDLLLDTEAPSFYETEGVMNGTLEQPSEDLVQMAQATNADRHTGEIRKAFYCPRCGNTFETQTEMVQHLREHVISSSDTPKRGRGRPRKFHNTVDGRPGRGRGRPKKPVVENVEGEVLDFKTPSKTYSRKRKLDCIDIDQDYDKNYEDGDDEDDFADKMMDESDYTEASNDSEYTPKVEISVAVTRVQPRRSTRGKHSKFDEDYVYSMVKKEPKEEPSQIGFSNQVIAAGNIPEAEHSISNQSVGAGNQANVKRGRGRPRRIVDQNQSETTTVEKEQVGTLSFETIQESLMALKSNEIGDGDEEDKNKVVEHTDVADNVSPDTDLLYKSDISENIEILPLNGTEEVEEKDKSANFERSENTELKVSDKINEFEVFSEENLEESVGNDINKDDITFTQEQEEIKENVNEDQNVNKDQNVQKEDKVEENDNGAEIQEVSASVKTEDKGSVVVMFEETDDGSYGCAVCEDKFTNELDAISHFMQHDTKGTVSCKTCHDNFNGIEALLEHRKECTSSVQVLSEWEVPKSDNVLEFACDICKQAFKTAQYLYRHMVIHTDVFQCERCSKTFSRKDSMQKHILKCCPELAEKYKIFYCEVCLRVFSKESGKRRHIEKCKSVQCKTCLKIFISQSDMALHTCKMLDLDDTAKYSCGRCSKAFQSLYYLKQHQQLHDNHNACERCGKNFASKEELDGHKGLCETLEGIRLYGSGKCTVCFETFSNSKAFRNHFLSHTHPYHCDKCDKRFLRIGTLNSHDCECLNESACNVCSKTFKNQTNLDKHIKENGCMRYQCSACNEQFRSKSMAKDHNCIIEATEDVEAEIVSINNVREVCPTCGKSFSSKSNLTKHMILHGEKKYGCPHCAKFFHLDVYLKEHITCVHYNIFKYQCNVCGRLLKSKTGLIAHTRIFHAKNAEVFPCTKCGKVFKQKGNLRSHMYSHSKARNFKCDVCIKAFKYPDQLSRHKLEHKLMPRLKCSHCDKEFLRTYDLKKHLQVYHSGYIYVCGICSARCGHRHTLVRHYKRKHPESLNLTTQEGYLDNLLKHVSEVYDSSTDQGNTVATKCIVLDDKTAASADGLQIDQVDESAEMLSQDAAEALHSLALGRATAKQFQLLKDKGLFIQGEAGLIDGQDNDLIQDQGQVIIPQDSYIFAGQTGEHVQALDNNVAAAANEPQSVDGNIGMIHNPDGSISINGIQGIPQTIEGLDSGDGHIVILQIVDPESQDLQGEIIQFNQDQQGNIHLNEEQQEKLLQLNENQQGQVIQLNQSQEGEIIPLNQNVFETSDVFQAAELVQNSQIQTVVVDESASTGGVGQELADQATESGISQEFTITDTDIGQNDSEKLDAIPVISLEGGDPNIQAPMVYSQDVTCTDEIE